MLSFNRFYNKSGVPIPLPVAGWWFDGPSTNTYPSVVGNFPVTMSASTETIPDSFGASESAITNQNAVRTGAISNSFYSGSGEFSMMAWLRVRKTGYYVQCLVQRRGLSDNGGQMGANVEHGATGYYLGFWRGDAATISGTKAPVAVSYDVWHPIAITQQGTTIRMYADGALIHTGTITNYPQNTNPWYLFYDIRNVPMGAHGAVYFTGDVHSLMFWNKTLTLAQIQEWAKTRRPAMA